MIPWYFLDQTFEMPHLNLKAKLFVKMIKIPDSYQILSTEKTSDVESK